MARRTDSRARMVAAAAELFRRQGYHATAFSEIVAESGAPRGSIYFHFPGGKEELAVAAAALACDELAVTMEAASSEASDAAGFARAVAGVVSRRLESSGYRHGCPVATLVLELAPDVEPLRAELERGFAAWRSALAEQFERYGYAPAEAVNLGTLLMAILEGGLIMARADRSVEPIHTATETFVGLLGAPSPATPRRRAPGRRRPGGR